GDFNFIGQLHPGVDPLLGLLADNGGPTQTIRLIFGSPAIDAGDPAFLPPPATDQRGLPRVSGAHIDIGAYEAQQQSLVVDSTGDESDGNFSKFHLSLREAIERADAAPASIDFTNI